jgi:hypothetical protein
VFYKRNGLHYTDNIALQSIEDGEGGKINIATILINVTFFVTEEKYYIVVHSQQSPNFQHYDTAAYTSAFGNSNV